MEGFLKLEIGDVLADKLIDWTRLRRPVSGTYKNKTPASDSTILELRVDVDGRRPQQRLSGDVFKQRGLKVIDDFILTPDQQLFRFDQLRRELPGIHLRPLFFTTYEYSFVVEEVTKTDEAGAAVLTGPIIYYNDPSRTDETIEVRIKRVSLFSAPPEATVSIYKSGILVRSYCLPKISEYFRTVTLEIDRFQGTSFPQSVNTNLDPSPSDLPAQNVSTASVFRNGGIDISVIEDDVLNDPDSGDAGNNWSEAELHDLMEDRFDRFANTLQWNTYGVVVPRFGDPNYNSGYYGTMFDWGGWQAGDTYFRQGCGIAEDAIRGRTSGTLYDSNAKKERLILETFCHEVGHSFNLPHSWQRGDNPDAASESFMNYPWGYTGGGGESGFWSNFRWEFDDVELIWMRHQDRKNVIFGGNDWMGNNLSVYMEPEAEIGGSPLRLDLNADAVVDFAEPVRLVATLTNVSDVPQVVVDRLEPEDYFLTLYIRRPHGDFVRYVPPVRRLKSPGDVVELAPSESIQTSILVSFSAKGYLFQEPGEYRLRAYYGRTEESAIVSRALRLRVAAPKSREDEELAYLMFDRNVAKFLYFEGSERYPKIISDLEEAVRKYEKTNPGVVRHIRAALGIHASRNFKSARIEKDRRVVVARKSKAGEAIAHLKGAVAALPQAGQTLSDARYAQLTARLADSQVAHGATADAQKTLESAAQYLNQRKASRSVINVLAMRIRALDTTEKVR